MGGIRVFTHPADDLPACWGWHPCVRDVVVDKFDPAVLLLVSFPNMVEGGNETGLLRRRLLIHHIAALDPIGSHVGGEAGYRVHFIARPTEKCGMPESL